MIKVVRETCIAGAVIDTVIKGTKDPERRQRKPKMNATPAAVQQNNDRIAVKRLAAMMNNNFVPGDYHITLTYADIPSREEAEKELRNFLRRMRREFEKQNKECKYIAVTEYEHTRIHHHVVISYIDTNVINKQWKNGRVLYSALDRTRNYRKLAEYLVKETRKTFRDPNNATKRRFSSSKNLEKPITVRERISITKLFADPKAIKGYEIDTTTIRRYESPITGLEHLEYSMVSTEPVPRLKKWRSGEIVKRTESYRRFEELRLFEFNNDEIEIL